MTDNAVLRQPTVPVTMTWTFRPLLRLATGLLLLCLAACAVHPAQDRRGDLHATLAVLATSDLHGHVLGYDYYRLREDPSGGLDRIATLVAQARARYRNTLLVDNGDTLQGSPLADWQARVQPPDCSGRLAIHEAMDRLGYDAGTLGNHEFNYGLPFLSRVTGVPFNGDDPGCRGPNFPLVLSNLVRTQDGTPLLPPRLLLERHLYATTSDGRGRVLLLRIGLVGLAPPGILRWDHRHLDGRVRMADALQVLQAQVAALRTEGAEVIVALVHGGLDASPWDPGMDNPGWHVAASGLVDAIVLGHEHRRFPDPRASAPPYAELPGVDVAHGRVLDVPAVMPSFWGRALGVIELPLVRRDGHWQVRRASGRAFLMDVVDDQGTPVPADAGVADTVAEAHAGTLAWLARPIAESAQERSTFFAEVGDTSALDLVNQAQADYIRALVATSHPELRDLPLLSAAAPFRSGAAGPDDYTQVTAGPLTQRHAADLYLYPNTLVALKVTGAQLKAWLEQSARRFRRINPDVAAPQALVDTTVPGYNFDVIAGVHYVIDLTRPAGGRIVDLRHPDGRPVAPDEPFLVASNNYRAGNGAGIGLGAEAVVIDTQTGNREVLIDWLRQRGHTGTPAEVPLWRFAPLPARVKVEFTTRAGLPAEVRFGPHRLRHLRDLGDGRAIYCLHIDP